MLCFLFYKYSVSFATLQHFHRQKKLLSMISLERSKQAVLTIRVTDVATCFVIYDNEILGKPL